MFLRKKIVALFFLGCIFVTGFASAARAELLITPTMVAFDDKERFEIVTLVNTSNEMKSYTIGLRYNKMRESGAIYDPVEKSVTDFDLGKHLTFTPKRITLMPGAKQRVRLALKRPSEPIPPGDYRVHLEFSSVPVDEKTFNAVKPNKEKKVGAVVDIYVGFSIPVLLRVGQEDVKAGIEQIKFESTAEGGQQVQVPIQRQGGPYSLLGHLFVYQVTADGKEDLIGEVSNANIFPEVNRRVFKVVMNKKINPTGSIKVVYRNYDKQANQIFAEKVFPLQ